MDDLAKIYFEIIHRNNDIVKKETLQILGTAIANQPSL